MFGKKIIISAVWIIAVFFTFSLGQVNNDLPVEEDDEILRIDTQLIDVPIEVTDAGGKPLLNLKRENFVVYEDGIKQDLESFSATEAPFEVALLLDTSGSTRADLRLIKRSAQAFIDYLRPGDKVSIIAFNTDYEKDKRTNVTTPFAISEVLIELTDDRKQLAEALENVQTSNGTPFYDGLLQVAEKVFKNSPEGKFRGRRACEAPAPEGLQGNERGDGNGRGMVDIY